MFIAHSNLFDESRKNLLSCLVYFLISYFAAFIFGIFVFKFDALLDSLATIAFVLFLMSSLLYSLAFIRSVKNQKLLSYFLIASGLALHLGLLSATYIFNPPDDLLWNVDTVNMHLPGALNISSYLDGFHEIRETTSVWDKIYLTHIWVGLFFYLFGVNVISSIFALSVLKLITFFLIYNLGKKLFSERVGNIAIVVYGLAPTIFFHTISFGKEPMVQMLTMAVALFSFGVFIEKRYNQLPWLCISLMAISIERFYIFPMVLVTYFAVILLDRSIAIKLKTVLMVLSLAFISFFILKYGAAVDLTRPLEVLNHFRIAYNSYTDVAESGNMDLPYYLSILKILFTPFFTVSKFSLFYDLSYLLIWGSFTNQLIMFLGLISMILAIKKNFSRHLLFILPFVCFILLFAYIAPYSGRLRDSFYPLIAIYAAVLIDKFYKKPVIAVQ